MVRGVLIESMVRGLVFFFGLLFLTNRAARAEILTLGGWETAVGTTGNNDE